MNCKDKRGATVSFGPFIEMSFRWLPLAKGRVWTCVQLQHKQIILLSDLKCQWLTIFMSLLRHYYVIITPLLLHCYQWLKQVIMSSLLLHIMHFPYFHYYIVITHYYHYYHYYMLPTRQLAVGLGAAWTSWVVPSQMNHNSIFLCISRDEIKF